MTNGPQYPEYADDPNNPGNQPSWGQAPPPPNPPPPNQPPPNQPPPNQAPPQYGAGPYGPPAPGYGYPPSVPNNGKALASMITGILSIPLCYIGLILGIVAIVFAVVAKRDLQAHPGAQGGGGMATAGLVTGIIGTIIWGGFMALIVIGLSVAP